MIGGPRLVMLALTRARPRETTLRGTAAQFNPISVIRAGNASMSTTGASSGDPRVVTIDHDKRSSTVGPPPTPAPGEGETTTMTAALPLGVVLGKKNTHGAVTGATRRTTCASPTNLL